LRNYFYHREKPKNLFRVFYFQFLTDRKTFSSWTKTFNAQKNDESFFTFFVALWVRQRKVFKVFVFFCGQKMSAKQKLQLFLRLLCEDKIFFHFEELDKNGKMPITWGLLLRWQTE